MSADRGTPHLEGQRLGRSVVVRLRQAHQRGHRAPAGGRLEHRHGAVQPAAGGRDEVRAGAIIRKVSCAVLGVSCGCAWKKLWGAEQAVAPRRYHSQCSLTSEHILRRD